MQENILRHVDEKGKAMCLHGCPIGFTLNDGKDRENKFYLHHKYRTGLSESDPTR